MLARSNSQSLHVTTLTFCALLACAGRSAEAQNLPATSPTSVSQANSLPAPIAATSVSNKSTGARRRARITYNAGLLNVEANNSSLNGILRDISQLTGMKITGGVADERVFGNYGPADPSTVLATLLDGTGSNMLLKETASNGPKELILTPRTGGVTPPNPAASGYDDEDASADQSAQPAILPNMPGQQADQAREAARPRNQFQPFNNVLGSPSNTTETPSTIPTVNSVPTDSLSSPSTATPVSGIVDSTNPPPAGSTGFGSSTPTDPAVNAAKTPEQIFEQLQQLRRLAAQQQSGSGSTTPATTSPQ